LPQSGSTLRRLGRIDRAEPRLRDAVARRERSAGYPLVQALNELGLWCKAVGRYSEGRRHYLRARAILQAMGSADHEALATVYHNLAGIEHATGAYAAADTLAREGLAIRLADPRPSARLVAADEIALAAILDGLGRFDEAEALYLAGLGLLRRLSRRLPAEEGVAWGGLGALAVRQGRATEAIPLLERAVRLKRQTLGTAHPDVGLALHNLATAYHRAGREASARTTGAGALAILERRLGSRHPWTMACRDLLAARSPTTTPLDQEPACRKSRRRPQAGGSPPRSSRRRPCGSSRRTSTSSSSGSRRSPLRLG